MLRRIGRVRLAIGPVAFIALAVAAGAAAGLGFRGRRRDAPRPSSSSSAAKAAVPRPESKFPEWSKVTEGCKPIDGLFQLYLQRARSEAADGDPLRINTTRNSSCRSRSPAGRA